MKLCNFWVVLIGFCGRAKRRCVAFDGLPKFQVLASLDSRLLLMEKIKMSTRAQYSHGLTQIQVLMSAIAQLDFSSCDV